MSDSFRVCRRIFFVILLGSLLSSCSFAPKYQRPEMDIPANYKEEGKWVVAQPRVASIIDERWWLIFEDPVLNILQEKVTQANQDIRIAYANYLLARADNQIVSSNLYPNIVGIGNGNRQQTSTTIANPGNPSIYNNVLLAANLNYEIDVWGRIHDLVSSSNSRLKASADDLAAVSLSLHAELAANYFSLRGNESAQRVLDKAVKSYEKALFLTRKRHEGGVAPIVDVDQATAQYERARTLATEARLEHAKLEHSIAVLIGEIPAAFTIEPEKLSPKLVSIVRELPSVLLERRPDIAAAELRVQAANAEIGAARAAFFPSFSFSSLLGFQSASFSNLLTKPSLIWSIGPANALNLIQPTARLVLADGGQLRGLLNSAKAEYFGTVAVYRQTVLKAFEEVENSLATIRYLDQAYRSQNAELIAAQHALIQAQKRYVGGVENYLTVVVSENIALQAELSNNSIQTRQRIARVQLIKALGGGWQACA